MFIQEREINFVKKSITGYNNIQSILREFNNFKWLRDYRVAHAHTHTDADFIK